MSDLLHHLVKSCSESQPFTDLSVNVVTRLQACMASGDKLHRLPSAAQGIMWRSFHKLRNNKELKQLWGNFVDTVEVPEAVLKESHLALQLTLDRVLKKLIEIKARALEKPVRDAAVIPLSICEKKMQFNTWQGM